MQAVAAATSKIRNFETRSSYLATKARMTTAESKEYNRYIDIKRDAKRNCYEAYTANFANNYLNESEIMYCSKYLPLINAELCYQTPRYYEYHPEWCSVGSYPPEREDGQYFGISILDYGKEWYVERPQKHVVIPVEIVCVE